MNELLHEYDAVKRREYYLRNRKLKGRHKKAVVAPAKKTHAQRQKELQARIKRLQDRLEQLRVALKALTEAAQKRSGIDKNTAEKAASKYQSKTSSDPTSKYHKTQKQKDDAAKAAKKYRDKNATLNDQVKDLNNKIHAIRERIKRIQKTGSVGASKSTTR